MALLQMFRSKKKKEPRFSDADREWIQFCLEETGQIQSWNEGKCELGPGLQHLVAAVAFLKSGERDTDAASGFSVIHPEALEMMWEDYHSTDIFDQRTIALFEYVEAVSQRRAVNKAAMLQRLFDFGWSRPQMMEATILAACRGRPQLPLCNLSTISPLTKNAA